MSTLLPQIVFLGVVTGVVPSAQQPGALEEGPVAAIEIREGGQKPATLFLDCSALRGMEGSLANPVFAAAASPENQEAQDRLNDLRKELGLAAASLECPLSSSWGPGGK